MAKGRRLTKASYYRWLKKRYQLELALLMKDELGAVVQGSREANQLAMKTAVEESYNWVVDQSAYHKIRGLVKTIAERYGIPTALQGLLMAYGEKVYANYFVDKKQETLTNLLWDYARKLSYALATAGGVPTVIVYVNGKPVNLTTVLRAITVQVAGLLNISPGAVGGAMSPTHLHV
jgi:hypothetical protein